MEAAEELEAFCTPAVTPLQSEHHMLLLLVPVVRGQRLQEPTGPLAATRPLEL